MQSSRRAPTLDARLSQNGSTISQDVSMVARYASVILPFVSVAAGKTEYGGLRSSMDASAIPLLASVPGVLDKSPWNIPCFHGGFRFASACFHYTQ